MQLDKLVQLFQEQFERCKLKPTESVVVLSGASSSSAYVQAALEAAQNLGARPLQLHVPAQRATVGDNALETVGKTPVTGLSAAMACLKQADLVVDMLLLLHSPEQVEILNAGTRMLLVLEPAEVLESRPPTEELKASVIASAQVFSGARKLRLSSDAGTDLEMAIGQFPVITQYGVADEPGRWDHWPSAFLYTWPNEGSTNGTVVIDKDDFIWPLNHYAESAIRLTVKNGYVTDIEGGPDADRLRKEMASFNDPEAYAVAHIGWGVDPRADWFAVRKTPLRLGGTDPRSFAGNVQFSTGPNTEVGGSRNTMGHFDMPLRNCTLRLDERTVVQQGEVVPL
jgi:2,5-dihydroxypyridine 5,6-dioxygenase